MNVNYNDFYNSVLTMAHMIGYNKLEYFCPIHSNYRQACLMTNLSDEQIYSIIGMKIKETRIRLGMTQTELAKRINMVRTSLTNIESGKQKLAIHMLYKIAGVLKVPVTDLLPEVEGEELDIMVLLNQKKVTDERNNKTALETQEKERILYLLKPERRQSDDQKIKENTTSRRTTTK